MTASKSQTTIPEATVAWLMAGDPAIRWQTMRDLLDAPTKEWQAERQRTAETGWGARFLAEQEANGRWGGGFYSPKWVSSTYTLLTLIDIGIPPQHEASQRGAHLLVQEMLGETYDDRFQQRLEDLDHCIVGMMLRIGVYFGIDEARLEAIVENLLSERMEDNAWNCRRHRRPKPHHSSFHTTFNVLEGLREYVKAGTGKQIEAVLVAEQAALEFMLQHKLFRSDKTDVVIHHKFTLFSFPHRWYYDVLRGLSYFARANAARDNRLQEAIGLLQKKRRKDGYWPVQNRHPGKEFFQMEKTGGPSRWNTLRALRVLRWWAG